MRRVSVIENRPARASDLNECGAHASPLASAPLSQCRFHREGPRARALRSRRPPNRPSPREFEMFGGRDVCSSQQNADSSDAGTCLVRVTHPFHPLSGRELVCVGERYNMHGKRLLLRIDDDRVCSVPPQWTNRGAPDPETAVSGGRACIHIADLLGLAEVVEGLIEQKQRAPLRKDKDAATVNQTSPQPGLSRSRRASDRSSRKSGERNGG